MLKIKTLFLTCIKKASQYPCIYNYLIQNKTKLIVRSQGRKDYSESDNWYQLNRPREKWIYDSIKIIYPGTTNRPKFALDMNKQLFRNARVYAYLLREENIELYKVILPILNSSLTKYLITLKCPPKANNYFEMSTGFMESFPFILPDISIQQSFINISDNMMIFTKEFQETTQKFQRTIQRKFNLEELPGKLQNWYLLTYKEFIAELAKKKIKLSLSDEAEWESYFTAEATKALALKNHIDTTDKEIDQMVYELYGLNEEEIRIVEGEK